MMGVSIREVRVVLLCHVKITVRKCPSLSQEETPHWETERASTLIWYFQPPELWETSPCRPSLSSLGHRCNCLRRLIQRVHFTCAE